MRILKLAALFLGLASFANAGSYYSNSISTATGKASMTQAGSVCVAASSATSTTCTVRITGSDGSVQASSVSATHISGAINASHLTSGTVPGDRLDSSSITKQGNTFNGASQLLKADGNGNVGIGTGASAARARLEVKSGAVNYTAIGTGTSAVITNSLTGAALSVGAQSNGSVIQGLDLGGGPDPYHILLNPYGGKVGINAASVTASTLVVQGTIESTGGGYKFPDGTTQTTAAGSGSIGGSGTTGKIAKFTGSVAIGDSVITEDSGKIGIGVSPAAALHVYGGGKFQSSSTTGAFPVLNVVNDVDSTLLHVQQNGNIGINTATPTEKLQVNGTMKASSVDFPGAEVFIASKSVAGISSNTFSGLTTGVKYILRFKLQAIGIGATTVGLRFNNDSTNNYMTTLYTASTNGIAYHDFNVAFDRAIMTFTTGGAGLEIEGQADFSSLVNDTNDTMMRVQSTYYNDAETQWHSSHGGTRYNGGAGLSEVALVVSAGSYNGTMHLYRRNGE